MDRSQVKRIIMSTSVISITRGIIIFIIHVGNNIIINLQCFTRRPSFFFFLKKERVGPRLVWFFKGKVLFLSSSYRENQKNWYTCPQTSSRTCEKNLTRETLEALRPSREAIHLLLIIRLISCSKVIR